ncbi:uncharacterized protein [Montipora capricornis]|uniref:uncharacterized protein isoform X1 n=1 Tax=Montipora capricornis TaxID=246305 RepID=UPI0035F1AEDB
MTRHIVFVCLFLGFSAGAQSSNTTDDCRRVPLNLNDSRLCCDELQKQLATANCSSDANSNKTSDGGVCTAAATHADPQNLSELLLNHNFQYGVCCGSGLMLVVVLVLLACFRCCARKISKKRKALREHVTFNENGMSARSRTIDYAGTGGDAEARRDDMEGNQAQVEDDYLVPVEMQNEIQPGTTSGRENSAERREGHAIYNKDDRERLVPSNTTTLERDAADADVAIDLDEDNDYREYSTPFDKEMGKVPIDVQKYHYHQLYRMYENCIQGRVYMNLTANNNERDKQRGSETDAKDGALEECPSSPNYINVE